MIPKDHKGKAYLIQHRKFHYPFLSKPQESAFFLKVRRIFVQDQVHGHIFFKRKSRQVMLQKLPKNYERIFLTRKEAKDEVHRIENGLEEAYRKYKAERKAQCSNKTCTEQCECSAKHDPNLEETPSKEQCEHNRSE